MPEISRFYGIIIRMYYNEHDPPHFHAIVSDAEAQIGLEPIHLLRGELPNRAFSMVVEWAALHQRELLDNWNRLRTDQIARKVPPLR